MSIKVDENDPVGELEPSFPYRDVIIKRNVDMKEFYDLEDEIGRGKFGTVYRCREKSTGLTLAAKFVGIARREDRRNVEREVDIMRMLQHPRIIQLYDAFESSNVMCVVQELIEGGELFDRVIGDDFILTEKSCTVFVRQICEGVAFIHSKNILHLDLKPENILCLTRTGNRIKIIDFGLARQFDPSKKLQVLFGTPEFVAPEVVNFDSIGFGTDMWSVGVICYVLLSGLSPFMGETDVETMANVTIAQYDFDDEAFDDISEDAKDFIRKLLVKSREGRYTAAECLCHPWLARRPPLQPLLDTTKDNLRDTVESWGKRETSPTQVIVHNLPPTPPVTPVKLELVPTPVEHVPVATEDATPPAPTSVATSSVTSPATDSSATEEKEPPKVVIEQKPSEDSTKGSKNAGDLQSPSPSKQAKIDLVPVKSKEIKDTGPEEVKVSTFSWTKKPSGIQSQKSLPEGKPPVKTSSKSEEEKVSSKFPLKPSGSASNTGLFNSRIQQGGTQINITKKNLNTSPQPKIAGIVLGQTHPRGSESSGKDTKRESEATVTKPKIITHKIFVEGKDAETSTTAKPKEPVKLSNPINIDTQKLNPLLRNLQTDRFERRCSDISCFMHDIENSIDGASIMSEIKKLSTRLFESDLLDESNNNSSSFLRQIANRGVAPKRPKFRVTNLNRDVPIGSPPPATNMTYFIPPNPLTPESCQTHSAPQTPRSSPERVTEPLNKDVILRLFDKLEGHSENSSAESVSQTKHRSSEKKTKVTSISSK
ncbi:calcium/calmodulin-dependent protein kinase type 1G-like [Macrosteles quadrilineatus]|uniref:calcium/calmodulin-dependent protein kinase type 1G-like n=1 Tax=Macrosteles quadrilineatus TaxID=74068 RepID=UPI0023E341EE|nr:calcium/calmodulin-dependent protein kinase type 1G-like [Macrosteles quadrilineatus]XP_054262141.1 calcium/calmodulin-dependent protein kinase type 1G-like [Macrosteles quadrilineatus]